MKSVSWNWRRKYFDETFHSVYILCVHSCVIWNIVHKNKEYILVHRRLWHWFSIKDWSREHVLVLRKPLGGTGSTLWLYLLGKNQQLQLLESSTEVSRHRDVTLNYLEHHFSHTLIQRHPWGSPFCWSDTVLFANNATKQVAYSSTLHQCDFWRNKRRSGSIW